VIYYDGEPCGRYRVSSVVRNTYTEPESSDVTLILLNTGRERSVSIVGQSVTMLSSPRQNGYFR